MEIFFTLLLKILPLYLLIFFGYIAGRFLKVEGKNIAAIMFYLITPSLIIDTVSQTPMNFSILALPLFIFALCLVFCLTFLLIGKKIWGDDGQANIFALTVSTGNTGFFGVPVMLILFDESIIGLYIISFLGMDLFVLTIGYFIAARGNRSLRDSLIAALKLPMFYAFLAGVMMSLASLHLPAIFEPFNQQIKGAYTVLGMMIIGIGIAKVTSWKIGWRFISLAFCVRFLVWPLVIMAIIAVDRNILHLFNENIYICLTMFAIVPLGATSVAVASMLEIHPDKVATTVLLSTMFGLFYVPFMVGLILP
jgi:predicted permease